MEFPRRLRANSTHRAGRMLTEGDIRVTVTNSFERDTCPIEQGDHVTIRYKAMKDNRVDSKTHARPVPEEDRNWVRVPLAEATHVFIEVPAASGDFPDKVGTFYPRTGRFFPDNNADSTRVWAAQAIAWWLNDPTGEEAEYMDWKGMLFREESHCGRCGRTLTDPESIERGIGPECFGKSTDSHHQVKTNTKDKAAAHYQKQLKLIDDVKVKTILAEISTLDDYQIDHIRRELEMWQSVNRQSTR